MKNWMRKMISFITFELPFDADYISKQFEDTHHFFKKEFPQWSTNATRRKVIGTYWYVHVFSHFALLVGSTSLMALPTFPYFDIDTYLVFIFIVGIIAFVPLMPFQYLSGFYNNFLPKLDTIKETFERKQLEQQEKCRQAQLSNFSLALFFYVLSRINNIGTIQCDELSANLMTKLYGVDP